jgi:L-Ala-D/L-Glu epimerase
MQIQQAIIRRIDIPLVTRFKHASATHTSSKSIILEVVTDQGFHGYGECVPRDYVAGQTVDSVTDDLQEVLRGIKSVKFTSTTALFAWLRDFPLNFAAFKLATNARCALELALLDAWGKTIQTPIIQLLRPIKKDEFFYTSVIAVEETAVVEARLLKTKAEGFQHVKLKVGPDRISDKKNIQLARAILGSEVQIRVDANAKWDLDTAIERLNLFAQLGVAAIEQPMQVGLFPEYPILRQTVGDKIKIILDESLGSLSVIPALIKEQAATGFNLKISKLGGLFGSLEVYRRATENGITCQLGAYIGETSLLTAVGLIFAGLTGDLVAHEGAFGNQILGEDIVAQPIQFGQQGRLSIAALRTKPGIGIDIDPERIKNVTKSKVKMKLEKS